MRISYANIKFGVMRFFDRSIQIWSQNWLILFKTFLKSIYAYISNTIYIHEHKFLSQKALQY